MEQTFLSVWVLTEWSDPSPSPGWHWCWHPVGSGEDGTGFSCLIGILIEIGIFVLLSLFRQDFSVFMFSVFSVSMFVSLRFHFFAVTKLSPDLTLTAAAVFVSCTLSSITMGMFIGVMATWETEVTSAPVFFSRSLNNRLPISEFSVCPYLAPSFLFWRGRLPNFCNSLHKLSTSF